MAGNRRSSPRPGTPKVDDEVLRDLSKTVPIAFDLAEIFYAKKRLGQLVDGDNGWMKKAMLFGDGRIHPRFIVGGTVTNRASHTSPNIAQVPRVVFKKLPQFEEPNVSYRFTNEGIIYGIERSDGSFDRDLTPLLDPDGKQFIGVPKKAKPGETYLAKDGETYVAEGGEFIYDKDGKIETKKSLMKGRAGDHGFECRSLFVAPPGWVLMGSDQKGIELRCLGHYMHEYDKGDYLRLCVESDPHDLHQAVMELDSRDVAKTFIYACVPMDTTVLTRRGWKHHDELILGEDVLSYNAQTGKKEWTPLLEVVRYDEAPLVRVSDSYGFEAYCTPNHRWFGRSDHVSIHVRQACQITPDFRILKDVYVAGEYTGPLAVESHSAAPVWCIRTKNESFVMRQGDQITITGNTIYGAAPYKQGCTIDPSLALRPAAAKALGEEMNRRIMTRIPALGSVVKAIKREAKRGYVTALDGRKLFVRKIHAALNTKLQGAGATISKKWVVLFEQYCEDAGLVHGWDGDFAILAWVHDELQVAVRDDPETRAIAEDCIRRAALDAGRYFDFKAPVDVDVKFGRNWAATH
jgi:hypothetical protein